MSKYVVSVDSSYILSVSFFCVMIHGWVGTKQLLVAKCFKPLEKQRSRV